MNGRILSFALVTLAVIGVLCASLRTIPAPTHHIEKGLGRELFLK